MDAAAGRVAGVPLGGENEYSATSVILGESQFEGEVMSAVEHRPPTIRPAAPHGFVERITVSDDPGEQKLVQEVNAEVDRKIASGDLRVGVIEQGLYITRVSHVHRILSQRLSEYRMQRQNHISQPQPAQQPQPQAQSHPQQVTQQPDPSSYPYNDAGPMGPPMVPGANSPVRPAVDYGPQPSYSSGAGSDAPLQMPEYIDLDKESFLRDVEELARQQPKVAKPPAAKKRRKSSGIAEGSIPVDFSSLGIQNLRDKPTKPFYAKVVMHGREVKLRWHWGLKVDNGNILMLIVDSRWPAFKEASLNALGTLPEGVANLYIGDVKEDIDKVQAISVMSATVRFNFGIFRFMVFFPEK